MTKMTKADLIVALSGTSFSERYWALCNQHPNLKGTTPPRSLTKTVSLSAFERSPSPPRYDARDRSISIDLGSFSGRDWEGIFSASRSGLLELTLIGKDEYDTVGSNFPVLAYDAKRKVDPNFSRDRFSSGPPPYPRPSHNGEVEQMAAIAEAFLDLLSLALGAIATVERTSAATSD